MICKANIVFFQSQINVLFSSFHRVKFGVPLDEVCKNDIPGPLLVSNNQMFCYSQIFYSQTFYKTITSNDHDVILFQVLILKLNKEAPLRKDVFRAPGHQGNMKKLIHFLQTGHLVNMDNFSVYTIASVLKKFLRKIPGGVFGKEGEQQLFTVIQLESIEQQRDQIHR